VTTNAEMLWAWTGIGLAASIAGWIWPFRRGVSGIVINAATGAAGAVCFGLLGRFLGFDAMRLTATSLLFAAVGAVGALMVAHAVWAKLAPTFPRSGT
jgi:uncharacterized membrane protein YeaQ/YmgE (transglycosylase-associated protein family)